MLFPCFERRVVTMGAVTLSQLSRFRRTCPPFDFRPSSGIVSHCSHNLEAKVPYLPYLMYEQHEGR